MDHGVFRTRDFPLLDHPAQTTTYLDWTGAALPPASLIEKHCQYLTARLLGNPHSEHVPSKSSMDDMEMARREVLAYFRAAPDEYDVIFTSGATGATLLLQHFMFEGGELLLSADNHNSVNGLREVAKRAGARVRYVPLANDLNIDWREGEEMLAYSESKGNKLFCYPAKSNHSGMCHDLAWVSAAQRLGWRVLLDAAAYLANKRLDLRVVKPDFVPLSFYKMFGYPTGIGCLLIRKDAYRSLNKKWFAGGSILLVGVAKDFYAQEVDGHARFEDGTQNFASMSTVRRGLEYLEFLDSTSFDREDHALALSSTFAEGLRLLNRRAKFGNRYDIHSPSNTDIVTFSLLRRGVHVNAWEVEKAASERRICFRTGCFCNPGVNEKIFGYDVADFERLLATSRSGDDVTLERFKSVSGGKSIGAIRVSFGYANNLFDVQRALEFFTEQVLA